MPVENKLSKLEKAFLEFHWANPHVYERIDQLAKSQVGRGFKRLSIAMYFEIIRYEKMQTTGKPYKMANAHRAYYARMWNKNNPESPGKFLTHPLPSKGFKMKGGLG